MKPRRDARHSLWNTLADSSFPARFVIKALLFILVLGFVLFPNPVLFLRHIGNFKNHDALITTNLPALVEINAEINKLLPTNATPKQELQAVERFVYKNIKYQYDWYNWLNADYWPTAADVWERKREDCDGRAVLAASILRSRGFTNAMLVANVNHVWVSVGEDELMGPHREKNLRREGNKVVVSLPGFSTWMDMVAQLSAFPALRSLIIIFVAAGLMFHPCRHKGAFCLVAVLALTGYILLFEWSALRMKGDFPGFTLNFFLGASAVLAAATAALFSQRMLDRRRGTPPKPQFEDPGQRSIAVKLTHS